MNKKIIIFSTILFLAAISCKKKEDKPAEETPATPTTATPAYTPNCNGTTPTFAANVSPLIGSSCAVSGCHAAGSTNGVGELTNYAKISANATAIRSAVVAGRMPKTGTLTEAQKNTIVCWIDAGAKND
jgi:hypothetical protein